MSDVQKNDVISELEDGIKETITLEMIRRMQCDMDNYRDKMLEICTLLVKKYNIDIGRIHKILGSVTDNYVFYLMHAHEYAHWISLGINCQEYADKKQIYVVSHYDELKK